MKHVKVDVRPPLTSVTPRVFLVRQPIEVRVDADRVVYCAILDSMPSV
jgi:hypothetical protein